MLVEKQFNKLYWLSCLIVFIIITVRSIYVPFSHDEVATFNFYIQPGSFLPFLSHVDANGHFLMSASSWLCFKLFGSSPLSLRLPCILGFIVLCYSVFKFNKFFSGVFTKVIFSGAFILSYNFLAFYSLCRGYGLSMAFLMLALYYFFVFMRQGGFSQVWKFVLFSQIALSANLTLVFVLGITTGLMMLMQLKNKTFFKLSNILVLLIHGSLTFFWIKYAFYLQESGALYYGGGESYWKVTFVTLIETIFFKSTWVNVLVLLGFVGMFVFWIYKAAKDRLKFVLENNFSQAFFTLCVLVIAFYLLKKVMGVNYPEDRTGLFFYVFYILSLCFMINELKRSWQVSFLVLPALYLVHFVSHINFRIHPWAVYETMPVEFYNALKAEQEKVPYRITIAGHRVREFFYAFLNYRSEVKLNHMTSPEALQMNCDYALAYKQDKPWYDKYYSEIGVDNDWNFRLLKRRVPLKREALCVSKDIAEYKGNDEYYNAFEKFDTTFNSQDPLLAEFEFDFEKAPIPFNGWLVLQVDGEDTADNFIVRVPLNLIKYDWNNTKSQTISIVSGNIPLKIKRIVGYLWNIDKQVIKMKVNSFHLFRLKGDGVREISKAIQ